MALPVFLRTSSELSAAIADQLLCAKVPDALRRALAAEHIRCAVYMASTGFGEGASAEPIHTTRILSNVRNALDGLWGAGAAHDSRGARLDDWCRAVLDQLEELGDVQSVGGGYWIATPMRLIELPGAETYLVLGTAPQHVVQSALGAVPSCSGIARFIPRASLKPSYERLMQTFDDWLGITEKLPQWTEIVIAEHAKRFSPPEDVSAEQVEVYAPDVAQKQRRGDAWIPAVQISQPFPKPRMCRPLASYAQRGRWPHYLGMFSFKSRSLTLRQTALLDPKIPGRLRFGFDHLLGVPRTVAVTSAQETCLLDMRFRLPSPQNRILPLSWNETGQAQVWHLNTFHRATLPAVMACLNQLCITPKVLQRSH